MNNFFNEVEDFVVANRLNQDLLETTQKFNLVPLNAQYSYNFTSLGRPIIQYPQDMVAMQELIWKVKPDLIIETGIAQGRSLIMSASMLALLDMREAIETGAALESNKSKRKVLDLDIDIRQHNREAIESNPMSSLMQMIQGSSSARGD